MKAGRNDPCPCGSGKKHKSCCWMKNQVGKKKFSAKVLSNIGKQATETITKPPVDLMERRFGKIVEQAEAKEKEVSQEENPGEDHSHCGEECKGHH